MQATEPAACSTILARLRLRSDGLQQSQDIVGSRRCSCPVEGPNLGAAVIELQRENELSILGYLAFELPEALLGLHLSLQMRVEQGNDAVFAVVADDPGDIPSRMLASQGTRVLGSASSEGSRIGLLAVAIAVGEITWEITCGAVHWCFLCFGPWHLEIEDLPYFRYREPGMLRDFHPESIKALRGKTMSRIATECYVGVKVNGPAPFRDAEPFGLPAGVVVG